MKKLNVILGLLVIGTMFVAGKMIASPGLPPAPPPDAPADPSTNAVSTNSPNYFQN